MSNIKKLMVSAAGGAGLDVEEVFSTYLYEGTNATQTITNGIDLDGEGGLVWFKGRDVNGDHQLLDSEQGFRYILESNNTDARFDFGANVITPQSDGFDLSVSSRVNQSGKDFASWTFRKAPKFFDVVTYTGDSSTGDETQTISHNLGTTVGTLIIKRTDGADDWYTYHRSVDFSAQYPLLSLNSTGIPQYNKTLLGSTEPTSTEFTVGAGNNISGRTYVAYLFAHNDGDGEFGADSDADIIKCGSYTNGASGVEVNLGFEPQWMVFKNINGGSWGIVDVMRGVNVVSSAGDNSNQLRANLPGVENAEYHPYPTSTGFKTVGSAGGGGGGSGDYIYIAIRRGTKVPESGTEVFSVSTRNASEPAYTSGFPVDFALARAKNIANNWDTGSRLQQGNRMFTNLTNAEASNSNMMFDYQDGWSAGTGASTEYLSWMFKRAPNFFDVVAYTGENGMGGQTDAKPHNLGVVPEMIWIKTRSLTGREWVVWVDGFGTGQTDGTGTKEWLYLNTNASLQSSTSSSNVPWGGPHTATTFSTGSWSRVNDTGETYIAYLFASLPGISKVGSFSHTFGGTTNVDCGFTSGARFVLWKRTDGTRHWEVFDTTRGIVAGDDAYLRLSEASGESSGDYIDPYSAGFSIGSALGTGEFIFYAIA